MWKAEARMQVEEMMEDWDRNPVPQTLLRHGKHIQMLKRIFNISIDELTLNLRKWKSYIEIDEVAKKGIYRMIEREEGDVEIVGDKYSVVFILQTSLPERLDEIIIDRAGYQRRLIEYEIKKEMDIIRRKLPRIKSWYKYIRL